MNAGAGVARTEMPGARVILLRERSVQADTEGGSPSMVTTDSVPPVAEVSPMIVVDAAGVHQGESAMCLLLGPYPESQAAQVLLDRLAALQIQGKYAAVEVAGEPDYWVYLRPEPTKELAVAKLRELQEKKIDSFIVPQGDIANGISLGVFDKHENAEKRQQAIIELGYDAQLRINPRNYLENWVVIYPGDSVRFSPELYNQLRLNNDKLDLRKDPCNKVASLLDIH